MLGAIIGDIVGSVYEFNNIKTKDFELFGEGVSFTDDSILTIATAEWLLKGGNPALFYASFHRSYPHPMGSYGTGFDIWARKSQANGDFAPYHSCGNGSAMRVSPVGWISLDKAEVMKKAEESAACTHNHPEGIKGAQATALCILLARKGYNKVAIRKAIEEEFGYDLSMNVGELQERYSWHGLDGKGDGGTCQDSVPQAIVCALQADSFEEALRNAVSIGGDSDTIACITGGIAESLFGIPRDISTRGLAYLPKGFKQIISEFEFLYGSRLID